MRNIKGLLIGLTGLFLVVTILSLLIPSKVITVRSVVVHVPPGRIMEQIANLKNWKNWHPVFMKEPGVIYSEPSTGVKAFAVWTSNEKVNKILITEINESGIKFLLVRKNEKDVENILSVRPTQDSTGLQVEWKTLTHLKWYPWDKFAGIFVDKMTGPGYEAALTSLQQYLEQQSVS